MTWQEVCEDRNLRNLPYKVELDGWGRIVMSPHRKEHGAYQGGIGVLLGRHLPGGKVLSECAIDTSEGVKVADVAWASHPRWGSMTEAPSCSIAPEICIEVASFSNTGVELEEKRRLYLEAGAEEVWLCDEEGRIGFFDASGPLTRSRRCPKFPTRVRI